MALTGNEILQVEGVDGAGRQAGTTFTTTTQQIANLASGGGAVTSVAGKTGAVILNESDIVGLSTDITNLKLGALIAPFGAATAGQIIQYRIPYAGTITKSWMDGDVSGSGVIGISINGASIVASAPPTLTSSQHSSDTTLTGWTKTFSVGDWISFSVTSVTTITSLSCTLFVTRT